MHQGCVFDPLSGHIQESTNECISKWNNKKKINVSLFPSLKKLIKKRRVNTNAREQLHKRGTFLNMQCLTKIERKGKLQR